MRLRFLLTVLLPIALVACPKREPKEEVKETSRASADSGTDEHPGLAKRVQLPAAVAAEAKIATATAGKETLNVTLDLPGEIAPDPDRAARISSPVAGRIEQVQFKEGAVVKKGDVLAIIRVPELGKVRAAKSAAAAKGKAARANAERTKALRDQRLASEQAYLDAESTAQSLEAEAKSLDEQLAGMGAGTEGSGFQLVLRAPLGGVVLTRQALVGQPVPADQTLGSIADLSEVWFLGRVFEKDLERIHLGAKVEVQLNAYSKERFDGVVEYLGRQVDPVARTVTARVRLTNRKDLLRVGLFGTARVATDEQEKHEPRIVVPRSALTEVAGKPVIFVKQTEDTYELHEITLGDAAIGKVEVLSGLREGEQIVVDGAFTLKSLVLKSTVAEED